MASTRLFGGDIASILYTLKKGKISRTELRKGGVLYDYMCASPSEMPPPPHYRHPPPPLRSPLANQLKAESMKAQF